MKSLAGLAFALMMTGQAFAGNNADQPRRFDGTPKCERMRHILQAQLHLDMRDLQTQVNRINRDTAARYGKTPPASAPVVNPYLELEAAPKEAAAVGMTLAQISALTADDVIAGFEHYCGPKR